jgi:hypothetical protein
MKQLEDVETEIKWTTLLQSLKDKFGPIEEVQDLVFLIGVQELGKGFQKFSKDEKVDIMHIGICHLLGRYGYYEFNGKDKEGWPHWEILKPLPYLEDKEKTLLLKKAILDYFEENN